MVNDESKRLMSREEEILNASADTFISCGDEFTRAIKMLWVTAFIAGAAWADKHPKNVWYDSSEAPAVNSTQIVYQDKSGLCWFASNQERFEYDWDWQRYAAAHQMVRWAYISDLLSKGGEQ